jgi:ubiquinone/menaquinone biosynthesis C-methylase UbiE
LRGADALRAVTAAAKIRPQSPHVIQYLSRVDHHAAFEDLYLKVRSTESRLLDDNVVAKLPYISENEAANYKEWQARAASFERLKTHFQTIRHPKSLLDIGCGNGWAAAGLAENSLIQVSAVDVNAEELEQADRVFQKPNLRFYYGDVFEDIFPAASFDYIVLNSSAQYFSDIKSLIVRLFYFLKKDGEIHILDTPFYGDGDIYEARARTQAYYSSIGCPEMAQHYFHHRLSELAGFRPEILSGKGLAMRLRALFSRHVPGHFHWIRIRSLR